MSSLRVCFWIFAGLTHLTYEHVGGAGEGRGEGESVSQMDSPMPGDTDTSIDVNSAEGSDFTDVNMAMRNESVDVSAEYADAREEFEAATDGALSLPIIAYHVPIFTRLMSVHNMYDL